MPSISTLARRIVKANKDAYRDWLIDHQLKKDDPRRRRLEIARERDEITEDFLRENPEDKKRGW